MSITKWQLIFLFIGLMDFGAGRLIIIVGTGAGHLPTKIARRAEHLNIFSNARGLPGPFSRVQMLAAGIDSHISKPLSSRHLSYIRIKLNKTNYKINSIIRIALPD